MRIIRVMIMSIMRMIKVADNNDIIVHFINFLGVTRQLYNSKTVVNGRPSQYLSDLMELPDGRILISDASATFDYASRFWIMFEGRADGRYDSVFLFGALGYIFYKNYKKLERNVCLNKFTLYF